MKKIISVIIVAALSLLLILSASSESVLSGDVSGDGKIAANDARAVLRIAAQIDEADSRTRLIADVDGNGRITAADARKILRISAKLEESPGSIEIEESTTAEQKGEKTELISGFGMSFESFMEKFGVLSQDETADGTVSYSNEYIKVVSDPKMISGERISSIIINGGDYSIEDVYVGMSFSDAGSKLESNGWRLSSGTGASPVVYENGYGMLMKLSASDGKIIRVEYCLEETTAESTTEEPVTDETTTEEETTAGEETTAPEETTKAGETTTKEPETIEEPENIASLPAQLKAFIYGKFGLDGDNYSYGEKITTTPMTMYIDGDNMSVSTGMDMGSGKTLNITILTTGLGSGQSANKMYIILENKKYYCELTDTVMAMLGMSSDEVSQGLNLTPADITKVNVTSKTVTEQGVEYAVYEVSEYDVSFTRIYMLGDEIKRIVPFSNGLQSGRIDVNEFYVEIPDGKLSLKGYEKRSAALLIGAMLTV